MTGLLARVVKLEITSSQIAALDGGVIFNPRLYADVIR